MFLILINVGFAVGFLVHSLAGSNLYETVPSGCCALALVFFAGFLVNDLIWNRKKLWQISDEQASRWLDEMCFSEPWQRFARQFDDMELAKRTYKTIQTAMDLGLWGEVNRLESERSHKEINALLDQIKTQALCQSNDPPQKHRSEAKDNLS
jgi:hypothetical protein